MDVSSGYRIPAWLLAAYALLTFLLGWFCADARNEWRQQASHATPTTMAAPTNIATSAPKPATIGLPPEPGCNEKKLAALRYSAHIWADEPQQRSVTLNGRQYRQGDALACGEEIVDIEPELLIINAFGRYLRLHALTDWPGGDLAPLAIDEQPASELAAAPGAGNATVAGQAADNEAGGQAASTEASLHAGGAAQHAMSRVDQQAYQANAAAISTDNAGADAQAESDPLVGFAASAAGVGNHTTASAHKASDAVGHADVSAPIAATAAEGLPGNNGEQAVSGAKDNAADSIVNGADKQVDASGLPVPADDDRVEQVATQVNSVTAGSVAQLNTTGQTGERQP